MRAHTHSLAFSRPMKLSFVQDRMLEREMEMDKLFAVMEEQRKAFESGANDDGSEMGDEDSETR